MTGYTSRMNKIKSVFAIVMIALFTVMATAQTVFTGATTVMSGGTNNVAATATNTYSLRIDVPRASEFALFVSAKPVSSNSVTLTLTLYPSLDGVTVASIDPVYYQLTGTTNTSGIVVGVENITAGAIPYYFLTTGGNAEPVAATNVTVAYGAKISR